MFLLCFFHWCWVRIDKMTLFQCIVCATKVSCVCNTKLFVYVSNMHSVTKLAPRWRGLMHIKAVDNQKYIFVPTFFILKFRSIFFLLKGKKEFRVRTKKKVGLGHRNHIFFSLRLSILLQFLITWIKLFCLMLVQTHEGGWYVVLTVIPVYLT